MPIIILLIFILILVLISGSLLLKLASGILRRLLQLLASRDGKFLHRHDQPGPHSHSDNPTGHHPSSDRNDAAVLSLRGPW